MIKKSVTNLRYNLLVKAYKKKHFDMFPVLLNCFQICVSTLG